MKAQLESNPQVSKALSKAQEWQEELKDKAQIATRATTEYVEENPWKAIAIVAISALALGFLLKPRSY